MTQSPMAMGAQPVCCGAELILSVKSSGTLGRIWQTERRVAQHPDYRVWRPGGCTFCLMGRVNYAASMPAEEAARLSDFQLSCATRLTSCLTLEELDPAAREWGLYSPPWGEASETDTVRTPPGPCAVPIYARARDAKAIAKVEALEDANIVGVDEDKIISENVRVRLLGVIKGAWPWQPEKRRITLEGEMTDGGPRPPVPVRQGERLFLLMSPSVEDAPTPWHFRSCDAVPDEQGVEDTVKRGIALDDKLVGYEPTVSFEGFQRVAPTPYEQ